MDIKITKKEINATNKTVLDVPYCAAQNLLQYQEKIGYSAGTYGWACDYYNVDNIIISTGYRPTGNSVDYATLKKYEEQASQCTTRTKINNLLQKWIKAELNRKK